MCCCNGHRVLSIDSLSINYSGVELTIEIFLFCIFEAQDLL